MIIKTQIKVVKVSGNIRKPFIVTHFISSSPNRDAQNIHIHIDDGITPSVYFSSRVPNTISGLPLNPVSITPWIGKVCQYFSTPSQHLELLKMDIMLKVTNVLIA
jgi:hypothetical protein